MIPGDSSTSGAPSRRRASRNRTELETEKRNLLRCLEEDRAVLAHPAAAVAAVAGTENGEIAPLRAEIGLLRQQLQSANATSDLLQDEVRRLETKALDAIAEVGRLRRQLDEMNEKRTAADLPDTQNLQRQLLDTCQERSLLTEALGNSEAEIGRLTRSLDLLVRKLNVA